jgi:hypothetical protein
MFAGRPLLRWMIRPSSWVGMVTDQGASAWNGHGPNWSPLPPRPDGFDATQKSCRFRTKSRRRIAGVSRCEHRCGRFLPPAQVEAAADASKCCNVECTIHSITSSARIVLESVPRWRPTASATHSRAGRRLCSGRTNARCGGDGWTVDLRHGSAEVFRIESHSRQC